jgi:peptide/nickel transport system ATP-binding protein
MTEMMPEPILALENVSKVFGRADKPVYAARSVSFALHPGRTLALVGESGSGKTTAARLIMREYSPDEGRLLFRGAPLGKGDAKALKAYRSSVQMVFQDPFASLNPTHTIRYHLERPLKLHQKGLTAAERRAAIVELLERVKLDPKLIMGKFPHELSGGQRQRISIARALAVNPQVIVADEPTSMLDVSVRQGILNLLNDMKAELKLALLYITHDIATARYVADDIMVMYAGQIVEWGAVDRVLDDPQHPYTRLLLSAVPDPDRRFDDVRFADELGRIEDIRRQAALPQPEITQAGDNHFYRPIPA